MGSFLLVTTTDVVGFANNSVIAPLALLAA